MYWRTSLVCLSTGAAWGYIALRIEARAAWENDFIVLLETWPQALVPVLASLAVGAGVALGLELAHRIARYLVCRAVAWRRRRRHDTGVPFPARNIRLTAYCVGAALVAVMPKALILSLSLALSPTRDAVLLDSLLLLLGTFAFVMVPLDAGHFALRAIVWLCRRRAARLGKPWQDGPVAFRRRPARRRAPDPPYPPRDAALTVATAAAAIAAGTVAALGVADGQRWDYRPAEMLGDAVAPFVMHFLTTVAICELPHQLIRFVTWPESFEPRHPPPARRHRP